MFRLFLILTKTHVFLLLPIIVALNFAYQIDNPIDSSKPFIFMNINNVVKFTPQNYIPFMETSNPSYRW